MGRAGVLLRLGFACLVAAAPPARSQQLQVERRLVHPGGVSITLKHIEARRDTIVLFATVGNPTDRAVSLDRAGSTAIEDGAHRTHRLNPPLDNPELRLPPHAQANASLVFVGPLAPGERELTLSINRGVGTADNPYDDAPAFEATLPLDGLKGSAAGNIVGHPDGVMLDVSRLAAAGSGCLASLVATNGSDRTIVLNQNRSLVLSDDRGALAPLAAPADNTELVVPAGSRLDAELLFDCRALSGAGEVTLATNRGTAGTADNPYETLPVFSLRLPVEQLPEGTALPQRSQAAVLPIARSSLTEVAAAATAGGSPSAAPGVTGATGTASAAATSAAPRPTGAKPAAEPEASAEREAKEPPKTATQLEATLHASHGYHGLQVVLPADALFGSARDTLDTAADPTLANVAALIAALHPREVIVAGHTDSNGSEADNLSLSKARAEAVAAWLETHVEKRRPRFVEDGYGRTRPVAPNHKADGSDNPEGRAQNRRIEITLRR